MCGRLAEDTYVYQYMHHANFVPTSTEPSPELMQQLQQLSEVDHLLYQVRPFFCLSLLAPIPSLSFPPLLLPTLFFASLSLSVPASALLFFETVQTGKRGGRVIFFTCISVPLFLPSFLHSCGTRFLRTASGR